jgi:hypothetical protein
MTAVLSYHSEKYGTLGSFDTCAKDTNGIEVIVAHLAMKRLKSSSVAHSLVRIWEVRRG